MKRLIDMNDKELEQACNQNNKGKNKMTNLTTIKNYIKLDKQILEVQAIADTKDNVEHGSDEYYTAKAAQAKAEKLQAKIEKLWDTMFETAEDTTESEWYALVEKAMQSLNITISEYALENINHSDWR